MLLKSETINYWKIVNCCFLFPKYYIKTKKYYIKHKKKIYVKYSYLIT